MNSYRLGEGSGSRNRFKNSFVSVSIRCVWICSVFF